MADKILPQASKSEHADPTCEHGTAMDVHCCGCHSGFLFDSAACVCLSESKPKMSSEHDTWPWTEPSVRAIAKATERKPRVSWLPESVRLPDACKVCGARWSCEHEQ